MLWQLSPAVIAEFIASAILLLLAIYFPWRDLSRQARLTGVTLIFVCALWMLSNAIEIGFPVASYKESLVGAQLVLGAIALTLWLFYILHYLGPKYLLARRIHILFGIMPLIAILALLTNSAYGLMWTEIGLDSQNPYLPLQPTYGIVYWACMVYLAVLTTAGSFLIIWSIFRRRYSYSRESIYLLLAAVLPVITAFIEVMGLPSFLKLPIGLTPWAACIGSIILILNLPRFRLEQVIPVTRDIIVERIGDCIFVLDKQNRVLDLNPAAEQLIGCRISDALGLSIEGLWPHQSTPTMPLNKMFESDEDLVIEGDGKQKDYSVNIFTINDSGGNLTSQVILLTDITKRKQAVEALRESEQRWQFALEGAGDGLWDWDAQTNQVYFSHKWKAMLGYGDDEIGDTLDEWDKRIHPDDRERTYAELNPHLEGSAPAYVSEHRVLCKDGTYKWILDRGMVISRTPEGKPLRVIGTHSDITERKRAEGALRESETHYRALVEGIPGVVYSFSKKRGGVYYSSYVTNLLGYSPEQLYAQPLLWHKSIHPDDLLRIEQVIRESAAGEPFRVEYRILDALGNWHSFDDRSFSYQMDGADVIIDGLALDVTESKLSEEKLLKSYESVTKTLNDAINTMVKIVELRDPYTSGHQQKVADLATAIAGEMKLDDSLIDQLRTAALIHDIGKMYVPSDILSKPGILSTIELDLIKTHSRSGYDIVKSMDFPTNVAEAVLQHHERLDGSGYPNQLKGDDTILEAKILAVSDVVEAMSSHRPYRPALGVDKALEEISKNKGKLYDPGVVDTCVELFNSGRFEFK